MFAPTLGSVAISPPNNDNVWRDYTVSFTTNASGNGSTSVVIYIEDVDGDDAINPTPDQRPCAELRAGESGYDDFGLFKASDVP